MGSLVKKRRKRMRKKKHRKMLKRTRAQPLGDDVRFALGRPHQIGRSGRRCGRSLCDRQVGVVMGPVDKPG